MERKASVVWQGGLKDGHGEITTDSGTLLNAGYSLRTRFNGEKGTNPEELIAAAHAACFSMALSSQLGKLGLTPQRMTTSGKASLGKIGEDWTVTALQLITVAVVPGADQLTFEKAANEAKNGCPISRLMNAPITLQARLEAVETEEKKAG